jgi:microcystin degradation protein MlrC
MLRVAVGGFAHETNTFSPRKTDLNEFEAEEIRRGSEIEKAAGTRTTPGGFVDAIAADPELELVPIIVSSAIPGGVVTKRAVETIEGELAEGLKREQPDSVVLFLHGAMVTELSDDGEGETLARVREAVGPDVPVMMVLDCHANVTQKMVDLADVILPFDTYPHVDGHERGVEAVQLAKKMLLGELQPAKGYARVPLMAAPPRQFTGADPALAIMNKAFAYEADERVVNVGVNWGFAYADTPVTGMSFVVTTNGDQALAQSIADEMAAFAWERRQEFIPEALSVEQAIKEAIAEPEGPVVLADLGDNPGGGTTCDGTAILWGLLDLGADNAAIGPIADPEVVALAFDAGVGAHLSCMLGGKVDELHGYPIPVEAEVVSLSDGHFVYEGPMGGGDTGWLGRTAVLACEGRHGSKVEVIVSERRVQALDTALFRSQGVIPEEKKIIVVKSAVHFRGAFTPIAKRIIEVDTPGLLAIDLDRFEYHRIPRPMWPLDRE